MEGTMVRKIIIFGIIAMMIPFFVSAQANEESSESSEQMSEREMKKEMAQIASKIAEIEKDIANLNEESVKARDIRWKVCLDDHLGSIKGVAASAITAQSRMSDLIAAGKIEEAYGQLILLRGLNESAGKSMNDSMSCERQLTRVSSDTEVVIEVNEELTGEVKKDGVSDAMGVGFSDEFVADGDKSSVAGSGIADAAGVDRNDVPGDTPENDGGMSKSERESIEFIGVPDSIDASPTK